MVLDAEKQINKVAQIQEINGNVVFGLKDDSIIKINEISVKMTIEKDNISQKKNLNEDKIWVNENIKMNVVKIIDDKVKNDRKSNFIKSINIIGIMIFIKR